MNERAQRSALVQEPLSSLDELAKALRCLPGVGPKAAQRMALHLMQHDREGAQGLALDLHVDSVLEGTRDHIGTARAKNKLRR